VIANSRARAAHSRRVVAIWLVTFVGALIQLGLCSLDVPPEVGISEMLAQAPAGACWVAGADAAERASSARSCRLLHEALGARAAAGEHRTAALRSIGVVSGGALLAAWTTDSRPGHGSARRWAEACRARTACAGARLLVRLCVRRT
jgi:hypothetical protein